LSIVIRNKRIVNIKELVILLGMIIAYIINQEKMIMPIYEYRCVDCHGLDQRVAGLDDHTALCTQCGSLMLRLDEDVFQPYFEEVAPPAWPAKASR